jgi:hypothetical protein
MKQLFSIVTAIRYLIIILGLEFGSIANTAYARWRAIDALAIGCILIVFVTHLLTKMKRNYFKTEKECFAYVSAKKYSFP